MAILSSIPSKTRNFNLPERGASQAELPGCAAGAARQLQQPPLR